MPFVTLSTTSIRSTPAGRKPSLLVRLARTVNEARTRRCLEAIPDPATGRVDPDLEQRVLRLMAP